VNKIYTRIVALILVPCLWADPARAALSSPFSASQTCFSSSNVFTNQALVAASWLAHPIRWIQRASALLREDDDHRYNLYWVVIEDFPFKVPILHKESIIRPVQYMESNGDDTSSGKPDELVSFQIKFESGLFYLFDPSGRREYKHPHELAPIIFDQLNISLAQHPDERVRALIPSLSGEKAQPRRGYPNLQKVLDETLKNSKRAILEAGKKIGNVEMTMQVAGNFVTLRIKDDGKGLGDADRKRLFTIYSTKREGGKPIPDTGYGLHDSRGFVESVLFGTMELFDNKSDLGEGPGATVVITIPLGSEGNRSSASNVNESKRLRSRREPRHTANILSAA
jgi:hypothetical protein